MDDIPEQSTPLASPDLQIEVDEPVAKVEASLAAPEAAAMETKALETKIEQLSAQLEESFARARETQGKLQDEHDRLLRTAAELENFKRRALKEREDLQKFGNERLLRDFLPVADNLERALDHADTHEPKVVLDGVRLVQKMLDQALAKHGVTAFSALGKPFDPALHEALMQQDSDLAPGTVVSEMAKGYKLNDRLIRPAAVVVAKVSEPEQVSDTVVEGGSDSEVPSSSGVENESD